MQAFFHVKLKFATIVIQDDSPLLPGIGFTKQPFSALYSTNGQPDWVSIIQGRLLTQTRLWAFFLQRHPVS